MKNNKRTLQILESSYTKEIVIMLSIDNAISPNEKVIKTTVGEIHFYVIKGYLYDNHMHLMLSWWERNEFYNTYYIKNNEIHIIRGDFGYSGSYGSRFWERCTGHNKYTISRIDNSVNFTPIQRPVLKNEKEFTKDMTSMLLPIYW